MNELEYLKQKNLEYQIVLEEIAGRRSGLTLPASVKAEEVLDKHIDLSRKLGLLNIANPIEWAAEQFQCAMLILDDMGIPRADINSLDAPIFSLVGRIKILATRDNIRNLLREFDGEEITEDLIKRMSKKLQDHWEESQKWKF